MRNCRKPDHGGHLIKFNTELRWCNRPSIASHVIPVSPGHDIAVHSHLSRQILSVSHPSVSLPAIINISTSLISSSGAQYVERDWMI